MVLMEGLIVKTSEGQLSPTHALFFQIYHIQLYHSYMFWYFKTQITKTPVSKQPPGPKFEIEIFQTVQNSDNKNSGVVNPPPKPRDRVVSYILGVYLTLLIEGKLI